MTILVIMIHPCLLHTVSLVRSQGLGGGTRAAGGGEGGREEGGGGGGGGAGVQARPLGIPQHHPAGRQGLQR